MDAASTVLGWSSLPTEIRHLILYSLTQGGPGFSRYASVCKEWQSILEKINFAQLRITPSCLPDLDVFARSRRAVLKCVKFRILLQEYDCSRCDLMPDSDWAKRDQRTIEQALRALMCTLASWETGDNGLTIDISVYSPSDATHHHQNFVFGNYDADSEKQSGLIKDDKRHGWRGNRQVLFPPSSSLERVFSRIELTEAFWVNLPQVKAVTTIQFRRQTRRQWCQRSLQHLIPYFTGLEVMYYEPWRQWCQSHITETDEYNERFFKSLSECCLGEVVIFEDFDDYYVDDRPSLYHPSNPVAVRIANTVVSGALAQASLGVQSLSASFIVEAEQFFSACQSTWIWNELKSLALTSQILSPDDVGWAKTNNIFQIAASVAAKMPMLHTIALWNYCRRYRYAGVFLYQTLLGKHLAKITWRATWNVDFTSSVIRSWEATALGHGMLGLITVKENLDSEVVCKSHGHAIKYLKIPCQILHPDSGLQIQHEVSNYRVNTDRKQHHRFSNS